MADQDGAVIPGARVKLTTGGGERVVVSGADGRFSFEDVAVGSFRLTASANGFAMQEASSELQAGQRYEVPPFSLSVATDIEVQAISVHELAEEQIRVEEKQRVLGFIPNFYVIYEANPVPLAPSQKLELAWRSSMDPINFALTGAVAGTQQVQNRFAGYGQGVQGYAKRYAASYGTFLTGTMLGNAVLPIVLHQDPRYFYRGTGNPRSRVIYAIASAVRCKGDNGRWQPNYSSILGSLAAGGIANLYYPAADRDSAGLTFEDAAIGMAGSAAANLFQEFVVRKLTPHAREAASGQ